jgi:N utilization substance protein B
MRVALYEIRYRDDVPAPVAIDEAVSVAGRYCGAGAPAFVNGVLSAAAAGTGAPIAASSEVETEPQTTEAEAAARIAASSATEAERSATEAGAGARMVPPSAPRDEAAAPEGEAAATEAETELGGEREANGAGGAAA